jgi:methyltransferase (TIGR00027 family)
MTVEQTETPDHTAVRTALWRAIHVQVDRHHTCSPTRSVCNWWPLMTAGGLARTLDTFAQRRPEIASRLRVFEIDQPGTQDWKRRRLIELGYTIPDWLRYAPVDFETSANWWEQLCAAGFDPGRPAVVASTGVTMYLTEETTAATLRQLAGLAPASTVAMTFLLPTELLDPGDRSGRQTAEKGARASGTPFISFYNPQEMLGLAREAGVKDAQHVSGTVLAERYFANRTDGLCPSSGEDLLVATT